LYYADRVVHDAVGLVGRERVERAQAPRNHSSGTTGQVTCRQARLRRSRVCPPGCIHAHPWDFSTSRGMCMLETTGRDRRPGH
jgi:hypothetical protein